MGKFPVQTCVSHLPITATKIALRFTAVSSNHAGIASFAGQRPQNVSGPFPNFSFTECETVHSTRPTCSLVNIPTLTSSLAMNDLYQTQ